MGLRKQLFIDSKVAFRRYASGTQSRLQAPSATDDVRKTPHIVIAMPNSRAVMSWLGHGGGG